MKDQHKKSLAERCIKHPDNAFELKVSVGKGRGGKPAGILGTRKGSANLRGSISASNSVKDSPAQNTNYGGKVK